MPKKVNLLPSLRVDIADFEQASQDYAEQKQQHLSKNFLVDYYAEIVDGFRIEIANQTTNPGQFTVHNGLAFDRSGSIINNEDDANTARTHTLSSNGTYYVEVYLTSVASDTDARAFMDPTYDNGSDPSGDPRVPGKEFKHNVSTRLTPDWQIITPVSTTGFNIDTDANSLRVPLAIINVAGGVITGSTSVAKTVLASDVSAGATTIKVIDSRLVPDTGQITLDATLGGAESVNLNANDRINGILTLAAPLANSHTAGARVAVSNAGAAVFVLERTDPTRPTGTSTVDARPRYFLGNEGRGWVLNQDPYTVSGRNDLEVKTIKDYIDFLAGQIRELKFGAQQGSSLGKTAPPSSFSSAPRYYDNAGGLSGSRTNTVSVGDGSTSWGDFNTAQYGTAQAALQAAHNALPSGGGTIYVKAGTYTITTTSVTITKSVVFVGEGPAATIINCSGAIPAIVVDSTTISVRFDNLKIAASGTSYALGIEDAEYLNINNCFIEGLGGGGIISQGLFNNCDFTTDIDMVPFAPTEIHSSVFNSCVFENAGTGSTDYALLLQGGSDGINFIGCKFIAAGGSTADYLASITGTYNVVFNGCKFSGGDSNCVAISAIADFRTAILKCNSSTSNGLLRAEESEDLVVENCYSTVSVTGVGAVLNGNIKRSKIIGCTFSHQGGAAGSIGIYVDEASQIVINSCSFVNLSTAIELQALTDDITEVTISNCNITCAAGYGRNGFSLSSTSPNVLQDIKIIASSFNGLSDTTGGVYGVLCGGTGTNSRVDIIGCSFNHIGTTSIANVAGIYFSTRCGGLNISNSYFIDIKSSTYARAIGLEHTGDATGFHNCKIVGNEIFEIGITTALSARGIVVGSFDGLVIADNEISSIAHSGATTDRNNAIIIGYLATTDTASKDASIRGNVIKSISTSGLSDDTAAIGVYNAGKNISIVGNVIDGSNASVHGIWCDAASDPTVVVTDITVTGNVINGTCRQGIRIDGTTNDSTETRYCVSSNTLQGWTGIYAIDVNGGGANVECATISSNVMYGTGNLTGISVTNINTVAVTGNSCKIKDASIGSRGFIDSVGCIAMTIAGNAMHITDSNKSIMTLNTNDVTVISGNSVILDGTTMGGVHQVAENITSGRTFCSGNFVKVPAGKLSANLFLGANMSTESAKDDETAANFTLNPTAFSDVGLNVWVDS